MSDKYIGRFTIHVWGDDYFVWNLKDYDRNDIEFNRDNLETCSFVGLRQHLIIEGRSWMSGKVLYVMADDIREPLNEGIKARDECKARCDAYREEWLRKREIELAEQTNGVPKRDSYCLRL